MSAIVNMFRLDLLSMKNYWKSYAIVLIYPILFARSSHSMVATICCAVFAMLTSSIFSVQEKNHLTRLYGVLQLDKITVVGGRYLFALANMLVAIAVTMPIYLVINLVYGYDIQLTETLVAYAAGVLVFWFLCGVQLPIFFRYTYTRARMWVYMPFLLFLLIPLLSGLFPNWREWGVVRAFGAYFAWADSHITALALTLLGLGLLLAVVSFLVSLLVYRKHPQ